MEERAPVRERPERHSATLFDILLRFACDRGKREWTGEWSDKSERWSVSLRQQLGWSQKNDGTFWMTWQGERGDLFRMQRRLFVFTSWKQSRLQAGMARK